MGGGRQRKLIRHGTEVIEVERVTKYYGRTMAVEDVAFTVKEGEIVGFLGPNAAGKTTTLRIITGYLSATAGTARVAGYDVFDDSTAARRQIGYLPETVPLYNDLAVRAYLRFFAKLRGVPRAKRTGHVDDAIEKAGLGEVADSLVGKLSKGYRQRVGIAQALVHDPPVLILDEPTLGLDPRQITEVRQLIKSLGRKHTIVLSTHILPEVSMTCDRVVIINKGRIVAEDTVEGIGKHLRRSERTLIRIRRPPRNPRQAIRALDGVVDVERQRDDPNAFLVESRLGQDVREMLADLAVRGDWGLLELRPVSLTLEDVFLELTTEE